MGVWREGGGIFFRYVEGIHFARNSMLVCTSGYYSIWRFVNKLNQYALKTFLMSGSRSLGEAIIKIQIAKWDLTSNLDWSGVQGNNLIRNVCCRDKNSKHRSCDVFLCNSLVSLCMSYIIHATSFGTKPEISRKVLRQIHQFQYSAGNYFCGPECIKLESTTPGELQLRT